MRKIFCVCAVIVLLTAGGAFAGSLWNDNANWFADARPGRVGDIITVLVEERTDAKDEATMDVSKSSSANVNDGARGSGILNFIRGLTFTTANTATGDGSSERKHHATATLACIVTEVLPNGNLVIEGTRDIRTSEEILQLQLSGVIRPQDVNSDNQIHSRLVANAEISVKGHGVITRTQKPGLISQILQAVF